MPPTVLVVDDDPSIREALARLFKAAGIAVRLYASALDFIHDALPDGPCCAVLDLRMPGMSGLDLQEHLGRCGSGIPVIFLSGHGDVGTAVEALKMGALDFFEKPAFDTSALIARVREALGMHRRHLEREGERAAARERMARLTGREREIMERIARGERNKVIAIELGISERTVEIHRGRVMKKLAVRSLPELIGLLESR